MNRATGCAHMDLAVVSSLDTAGRTDLCGTSVLRAVFGRWEPERPELLIRLRPRLRGVAPHGTH